MSDDHATSESKPIALPTLSEKIEMWEGWDDSEWRADWFGVYNSVVRWAAGGAVIGFAHALTTGRSVLPNTLVFSGYTTVVSGCYFVSRELLFGREIERFRRESLALGLPEARARDYPWRWDMMCGAISGATFATLTAQSRNVVVASALLGGAVAFSARTTAIALSDYIVPKLLPHDTAAFERARKQLILSRSDLDRLDEEEYQQRVHQKPWFMTLLPDWFPIQAYSIAENEQREKDKAYEQWLEGEVKRMRVAVGVKRELKQLELERLAADGIVVDNGVQTADSTSTNQVTIGSGNGNTNDSL